MISNSILTMVVCSVVYAWYKMGLVLLAINDYRRLIIISTCQFQARKKKINDSEFSSVIFNSQIASGQNCVRAFSGLFSMGKVKLGNGGIPYNMREEWCHAQVGIIAIIGRRVESGQEQEAGKQTRVQHGHIMAMERQQQDNKMKISITMI